MTGEGRVPSRWIVSPSYDVVFFIASLLVPLTLWAAFHIGLISGVVVFILFQLLFNMPHNVQTWTMSVFDRDDRQKNWARYAVAFAIIVLLFGIPMLVSPSGVLPWVRDALVYWGYYHLVRQHYGFLRLYERRSSLAGERVSTFESKAYARFVDIASYAPLLLRFRDPELMTIRVEGKVVWVRHPVLPELAWKGVLVVYVGVIALAIGHHIYGMIRGRKQMLPRALLLTSITLAFSIAAIFVKNLVVAIAIVTSFHNLQYLGLVFFHNRNRARIESTEARPPNTNPALALLRSGRWGIYGALTMIYGVLLLIPMAVWPTVPLAELPITAVVALHYYVDSRLWRFQDYPRLGEFLGLKA